MIAIPSNSIKRIVKIQKSDISTFDHYPVLRCNDDVIPLFNLGYLLWNRLEEDMSYSSEEENVVIIGHAKNLLALVVDTLIGQEDIVVKPFESDIAHSNGISGATILGTGEIPLILDIMGVMNMAIQKRGEDSVNDVILR